MSRCMYWIDTGLRDPAENMAVDEALFLEGCPAVRFYGWSTPAYSIGYFQKAQGLDSHFPIVRRITGGGTVEHGKDLTFSAILNLKDFQFLEAVGKSYVWIHQGIFEGLESLGLPVEMYRHQKSGNGKFCFQAPGPGDIMLGDSKIVGGAQRRRGRLLLHQGSVRLDGLPVERRVLLGAILKGLSHTFKLKLTENFDTFLSLEKAIKILREKYMSRAWTYRI